VPLHYKGLTTELSQTHLHDGVLEFVEINWFETLELRVTTTQVIEERRQNLVVVVDIVDDDADSLHEP